MIQERRGLWALETMVGSGQPPGVHAFVVLLLAVKS
jgi:hypothetical protein